MTVFSLKIMPDDMEPILPYVRWKKKGPPSVVLFATNGRKAVVVVAHEGGDADYILNHSDNKDELIRELREWVFPGLWVWEGRVRSSRSYDGEYDEEYVGDIRPLTAAEEERLQDDDDPRDQELWREDQTALLLPLMEAYMQSATDEVALAYFKMWKNLTEVWSSYEKGTWLYTSQPKPIWEHLERLGVKDHRVSFGTNERRS